MFTPLAILFKQEHQGFVSGNVVGEIMVNIQRFSLVVWGDAWMSRAQTWSGCIL